MDWTDFAIAPLGPVYFGDGRPMAAGETDFGEGRFPPSPRTAQGIVRTALLRSVPGLALATGADAERIAKLVGPPERLPEGWQIVGPWLARWGSEADDGVSNLEPWLPVPKYVIQNAAQSGQERVPSLAAVRAKDLDRERVRWDAGDVGTIPNADSRNQYRLGYIAPADLLKLLNGTLPASDRVEWNLPPFARQEQRIGLRIEPGRDVAEEGMLYTLGYYRLADDSGLVVRFRGEVVVGGELSPVTRGTTSIGGKGRVARLLAVKSWSSEFNTCLEGKHLPAEPEDGARFWLWTTTPVPLPRPWAPALSITQYGGATLQVLTSCVGRLEHVGGFSLAGGRSHEAVACVPAGSAWLIRLQGGQPAERGRLLRSLHDAFPFQSDPPLHAMGFGHTLVSRVPNEWS